MLVEESTVHSFMEDAILPMINQDDEGSAAELEKKYFREKRLRQRIREYVAQTGHQGLMAVRFHREKVRELATILARDRANGRPMSYNKAAADHDWDQAVRQEGTRFGHILFSFDEHAKTAHIERIVVAERGVGWGRRLMKGMAEKLLPLQIKLVTVRLKRQDDESVWSFFRSYRFEAASPGTVDAAHLQASLDHPAFR